MLSKHLSAANDRESPLLRLEIAKLVMATPVQEIGVPAGLSTALRYHGILRTCRRLRKDFLHAFFAENVFVVRVSAGGDPTFAVWRLLWPSRNEPRRPIKHIYIIGSSRD